MKIGLSISQLFGFQLNGALLKTQDPNATSNAFGLHNFHINRVGRLNIQMRLQNCISPSDKFCATGLQGGKNVLSDKDVIGSCCKFSKALTPVFCAKLVNNK